MSGEFGEILSDGSLFRCDPGVPLQLDREVLTTRVPWPEDICPFGGDNLGGVFCSHELPAGPTVSRPVSAPTAAEVAEATDVEASFRARRRLLDGIVLVSNPATDRPVTPVGPPARRVFTFGYGHVDPITGVPLAEKCAIVTASDASRCRDLMIEHFGNRWAFEYDSVEQATPPGTRIRVHVRVDELTGLMYGECESGCGDQYEGHSALGCRLCECPAPYGKVLDGTVQA